MEYREDLLKSTLAKTMAAYSAIKKARRLLRARAIVDHGHSEQIVLSTAYDLYMDMVNDAQLDIENLARDVETSAPAFGDPDSLVRELRSMDSYLGKLIKEYETARSGFAGEVPSKKLSELDRLKEFVGPSKGSEFKDQVIIPYHNVQQGIRADLLHPQLVSAPGA